MTDFQCFRCIIKLISMKKIYLLLITFALSFSIQAQDLYDLNRVRDVKITFKQENWSKILNTYKEDGKNKRLTASITIDGIKYDGVGVRHKGNSSYYNVRKSGSTKLPFNIKADHKKKGQTFAGGYTALKLSNIFRDPSCVREVLAYEIAGKYMPAPRANFVRLYINGELLGLYNSTESVDEKFLATNFGTDDGTLIKCDPDWHGKTNPGCKKGQNGSLNYLGKDSLCYYDFYEMKSKHGWGDLVNLTKTIQDSPDKLGKVMNIDRALWMLAYNNVLVNLDSYTGRLCHNYYIYKDQNGIFNTIPWDMNMNFGGFRFLDDKTILNVEKLQKMSILTNYKNENRPLISKILTNKKYRKIYLAHVRTILKENFSNGEYEKRGKAIQRIIDRYVKDDTNKLYTYEDFKSNLNESAKAGKTPIVGITELMSGRIEYLEAHPLLSKVPPTLSNIQANKFDDDTTVTVDVKDGENVHMYYREKGFGVFKRMIMNDKGENGDSSEGDNTFSGIIPLTKNVEYYILALNEDAAMFSPERAAFEVHEIK